MSDSSLLINNTHRANRVLTLLGELLIPPSVLSIILAAMGVEPRAIAEYSLILILAVSVLLWRRAINRFVPAWVAMIVLLGAGFVVLKQGQRSLAGARAGFTGYHVPANAYLNNDLRYEIRTARSSIDFLGVDFHISAPEYRPILLEALSRGVDVRYLVCDPTSAVVPYLAAHFDTNENEMREIMQSSMSSLERLQEEWSSLRQSVQTPGTLQVRMYDTFPTLRLYLFDAANKNGSMYAVPYIPKIDSSESYGVVVVPRSNGVYSIYRRSFLMQWAVAQEIAARVQPG